MRLVDAVLYRHAACFEAVTGVDGWTTKHSGIDLIVDFAVPAGPLSASRLPEGNQLLSTSPCWDDVDNADNALEGDLGRTKRGLRPEGSPLAESCQSLACAKVKKELVLGKFSMLK
ncbi:hypothetical protein E4U58_005535 [Claviceps cyperi]|nr:hypothetical protein E4U58_005535 [Claviceps cyperi]